MRLRLRSVACCMLLPSEPLSLEASKMIGIYGCKRCRRCSLLVLVFITFGSYATLGFVCNTAGSLRSQNGSAILRSNSAISAKLWDRLQIEEDPGKDHLLV